MKFRPKTPHDDFSILLGDCHDDLYPTAWGSKTLYFTSTDAVEAFLNRAIGLFTSAWVFSNALNMPLGFYLDQNLSAGTELYVPNINVPIMKENGEFYWACALDFKDFAQIIDNM